MHSSDELRRVTALDDNHDCSDFTDIENLRYVRYMGASPAITGQFA